MPFLLARLVQLGERKHILILLSGVALVIMLGGWAFAATQHLPVTTGWYWALVTATTVGYGDVTPKNPSGRVVASLVMLTAIPMLASSFALFTGSAVSKRVRSLLQMTESAIPQGPFRLVVGDHPIARRILKELREAGDDVVYVAEVDAETVPDGVHFVHGDPASKDVLKKARPERSQHALILAPTDGDVLVLTVLLREQAPNLPMTALASAGPVAEALQGLGVGAVVSSDELVAHTLAKSLEAPHAGDLLLRLITSNGVRFVERPIEAASSPRPLSELRSVDGELVLGVVHEGRISLGVGDDPVVGAGDVLLVVEAASASSDKKQPHPTDG